MRQLGRKGSRCIVMILLLVVSSLTPSSWYRGDVQDVPRADAAGHQDADSRQAAEPVRDVNYTRLEQPPRVTQFADSMACVGDVDADGAEDMLVGANVTYEPGNPIHDAGGNYMLMGRSDGDFSGAQLQMVQNMSNLWATEDQRRAGDINGDGYGDIVSLPYGAFGFNGIAWDWDKIQVRYGGADGIPNESSPDTVDTRPSNLTGVHPLWMLYGGAGDVNGDGFDDLFVLLAPTTDYSGNEHQGQLALYHGGPGGISHSPNWTRSLPSSEMGRWHAVVGLHHADVNGDGFSDVLMRSQWTRTEGDKLEVLYGSKAGLPDAPNVTFPLYPTGSILSLQAPLDLDGDACEDIVVETYVYQADRNGKITNIEYGLFTILGRTIAGGMPVRWCYNITEGADGHDMVAEDVNGDGLDDIVTCTHSSEPSGVGPGAGGESVQMHINVSVHYTADGAIPEAPGWRGEMKDLVNGSWVSSLAGGDLDGDGLGDIAIGVKGEDPRDSSLVIVLGSEITGLQDPILIPEGKVLYAMHHAYDISVMANRDGLDPLPDDVRITLDPGGAAVVLGCAFGEPTSWISIVSDPGNLVSLAIDYSGITRNETSGATTVHFRVLFRWEWPGEDLCSIITEILRGGTGRGYLTRGAFRVEKDLALSGALSTKGEWQGPVAEGAWVRAGENVTVLGAEVVYEGTTDVHPPEGSCSVVMANDAGDSTSVRSGGDGLAALALVADSSTDLDEVLTLTLADLPPTSRCVSNLSLRLRVDGDLPVFKRAVPEPSDWHSSSRVLVSITADDGGTSGVDSSSLEYSFSTTGRAGFGDWTRTGLAVTSDGPEVDGLVALTLPDGAENYVRWRVMDLVGNGPAMSEGLNIKVDTRNVTFADPTPPDGEWQTALGVRAGIVIHDEVGSGIDLATVQYRLSPRNLSQYGEWLPWNASAAGTAPTLEAFVQVLVLESPYNFVQWRAFDIAGNGFTTSPHYRVPADVTPISFRGLLPAGGAIQTIDPVWCWATADDGPMGSGVDLSRMEYRCRNGTSGFTDWMTVGMVGSAANATFSVRVDFEDGLANAVQFRGYDVAGNGPSASEENPIALDTRPPAVEVRGPVADERYPGTVVGLEVVVTDATSGVEGSSLSYRIGSTGTSGYGDWTPLDTAEEGTGLKGTSTVHLAPGPGNLVQFRASDRVGNSVVLDPVRVWVNRPPVARISSPLDGSVVAEGDAVRLVGNASSDPDDDALAYEWTFDVPSVAPRSNATCELDLPAGPCNITLTVKDPYGGVSSAAITVNVTAQERPAPPAGRASPWPWLILILVVVACAIAIGWRARLKRRSGGGPGQNGR